MASDYWNGQQREKIKTLAVSCWHREMRVFLWLMGWGLPLCEVYASYPSPLSMSSLPVHDLGHFELFLQFILKNFSRMPFSWSGLEMYSQISFLYGWLPVLWITFRGFLQSALKTVTKKWKYFCSQLFSTTKDNLLLLI